ncbi:MAG: mechanosensitive ion channel family protein [Chromatiales bacterium]|nr:mechanosensitive ion channel family protein [Chromatiales bacterium]
MTEQTIYGITLLQWLAGLAASIGVAALLSLSMHLLDRRLTERAARRDTPLAEFLGGMFGGTSMPLALAAGLFVANAMLALPARAERTLDNLAMIALLLQAAIWINHGIRTWLGHAVERRRGVDGTGATTMAMLGFIGRVAVWSVALLMILSNLGFDITALVASLGIGGIAVALAVQNILGDIFASVSIALDKPFVIGDFIIVGDILGTVEYIGLKTTRLRSLSGEQIIMSNNDLLNSRIHNFQRMPERRVVFSFGVIYQTPVEKVEKIPGIVREAVENLPKTRFDRAHFRGFGESSLDFEVVYFTLDPAFNFFMDTQQAINLQMMRRFTQEGIDFAYPTRTLYTFSGQSPVNAHPGR